VGLSVPALAAAACPNTTRCCCVSQQRGARSCPRDLPASLSLSLTLSLSLPRYLSLSLSPSRSRAHLGRPPGAPRSAAAATRRQATRRWPRGRSFGSAALPSPPPAASRRCPHRPRTAHWPACTARAPPDGTVRETVRENAGVPPRHHRSGLVLRLQQMGRARVRLATGRAVRV
jgi:hypothetical protein